LTKTRENCDLRITICGWRGLWRGVFPRVPTLGKPKRLSRHSFKLVSQRDYRPRPKGIVANFSGTGPMALDHEILTVKDICEILQINQSTVYKLVREGRIPAFRIGSDWRFQKEGIVRWMAEQTKGAPQ
jgi:excisionase family DNA binding protein